MPEEVRFRLTVYQADGVTPLWGDESTSCFGTPGWSHPRPFLKVPENFLQTEVDFLKGSASIGGVSVEVIDRRTDSTDQTSGVVTAKIKDVIGAQAVLERYYDSLSSWRRIFSGEIQKYKPGSQLVAYRFDIDDPRAHEQDDLLFSKNETYVMGPQEAGPLVGYGALPTGGYMLPQARFVTATFKRPSGGSVPNPFKGVYYGTVPIQGPQVELIRKHATVDPITKKATGITVRWRVPTGSETSTRPPDPDFDDWVYLRDMPVVLLTDSAVIPTGNGGLLTAATPAIQLGGTGTDRLYFGSTDSDLIPADDQLVHYQVLAARTTEETPFFWDNGTLGDLLGEIRDGDHTKEVPREEYDATALAAFVAAAPPARFIVRSEAPRRRWVEENIYRAARFAPAIGRDGKIRPVQWALPTVTDDTPVLSRASIIPIGEWTQNAPRVVNTVEGTYIEESVKSQEVTIEIKTKKFLGVPYGTKEVRTETTLSAWERFFETEIPFGVSDEDSVDRIGVRPSSYAPKTLRVLGSIEGRPVGGDTQDPLAVQAATAFIEQTKVRYLPRGAPRWEAPCRMSDPVVRDVQDGDWLIVDAPWMPEYATGKREARRYMQVYGHSDPNPATRILFLEDGGRSAIAKGTDTEDADDDTADCLALGSDGAQVGPAPNGRAMLAFTADGDIVNGCDHDVTVRALLIGGGGGGGIGGTGGSGEASAGGGGGAGGVKGAGPDAPTPEAYLDITIGAGETVPVTVGAGGSAGGNGGNTTVWVDAEGNALDPMTDSPVYFAAGGGKGGTGTEGSTSAGTGGSGGGGGAAAPNSFGGFTAGGAASTPGDQGRAGGSGFGTLGLLNCRIALGGGGGSLGAAGTGPANGGGDPGEGGDGVFLSEFGVTTGAGGGGAHSRQETVEGACSGTIAENGSSRNGSGGAYGTGGGGGALPGGAQNGSAGAAFFVYAGALQELDPPPSSEDVDENDDQSICVTIATEDWPLILPTGYRVRVDYAISPTVPDAESGLWRLVDYLTAPGTVCTPPIPTGVKAWTRKVAESDELPPSTPDTPVDTESTCTAGALSFDLSRVDSAVTVEWEKNACAEGAKIAGAVVSEELGEDVEVALSILAEVDADDGTYALPIALAVGQQARVSMEFHDAYTVPVPGSPSVADDFDRADSADIGDEWEETEGSGTIAILSNKLRFSTTSGTQYAYRNDLSIGEMFVQAVVQRSGNGEPELLARWNGAVSSGYGLRLFAVGGSVAALRKFVTGSGSDLDTFGAELPDVTDWVAQLYVADDLQEGAMGPAGDPFQETAEATDNTYNGVSASVGFRFNRSTGTPSALFDNLLVFSSKNFTVTNLPTGYKAQIENSGASVVAQATESSGTAAIDCSGHGGATEIVPAAGWAALVIRDGSDVEVDRYTGAVYPGGSAAWNDDSSSLTGVTGNAGRVYSKTLVRKAPLVASPAEVAAASDGFLLDDDLNWMLDDDLNPMKDE